MGQFLLLVVVALTVGAVVFGVTVLLTGGDGGLSPAEPDGRAVPLPATRPLVESDIARVRFDVTARGYRMAQVDQAMRRAAYDIGYKDELINVLEAEVDALRSGRHSDAEVLRRAREAAQAAAPSATAPALAEGDSAAGTAGGDAARESSGVPGPAAAGTAAAGTAAPATAVAGTAVAGTAVTGTAVAEPGSAEANRAGSDEAGTDEARAGEAGTDESGTDQAGTDQAGHAEAGPAGADPTGIRQWTPDGTGDVTPDPAGRPADAGRDGDESGEPESDSIIPSRG